jgi:hypothetical protein
MPVRVVTSPFHRLRCVSCRQRVSDLDGPFFDFGELDGGDVELLQGDPLGKKQHHDDLLVCAGCLRKAAAKLPGENDRVAVAEREAGQAREERDRALRLAQQFSTEVKMKLDDALASDSLDPRGQSNVTLPSPETKAPPQISSANEQPPADIPPDGAVDDDDLDGLTLKQLRGFARERGIQIPGGMTRREDIAAHVEEQLTAPADDSE